MNSRNMIRVAVLGAVCLLGTVAVQAQAAPGAASSGKIGVIKLQLAIENTAEGRSAAAELQSQFASRRNELEALSKQINDIEQRLNAGAATLSQEEAGRLQQQGQRLQVQLQRKGNEFKEDQSSAADEVSNRIYKKMLDVIERYARENGLVAVLDNTSPTPPVLFASTNIDITQDIIKQYDQSYPLKAGATPAPAKPAATTPKPATPPATKP